MGELANRALAASKFLMLDVGESVFVQFVGYKFTPNKRDPTKEDVMYELKQQGYQKFWTNSSSKVMLKMDKVCPGEWIKISRQPALLQSGEVDPKKSKWSVEIIGDMPQEVAEAMIGAQKPAAAQILGNPGGVMKPEDIVDPFAT